MAAFQHFSNMHDVELKPRLLRSLFKDQVPDEKRPFGSPSDLSRVINLVQTHKLLSESFTETLEEKQVQRWRSAVDEWVERLLALVTSNSPDKCWAGICLLGVTTQECGSDRFSASYTVWFEKLLLHIQQPADSRFVMVASCNSVSDMITRLGRFPNARKDGTSLAGKTMQPMLKLLNGDNSEAIWEAAVHLLCTIITYFPAAVQRHYDSAEAAIAFKILSRKCSADMLKKFACCLALLPKSRGDEDSWFIMMQKILLLVNSQLSDIFQGLEEETRRNEAVKLLVPPGKDPPPPLGGPMLSEEGSLNATKRSDELVISCISALMHSCCEMLTSPYPAQVNVPIRALLALVERVLMVDGSLSRNMLLFMTAMQQELICAELPVLHLSSLELLISIIKGMRSQLLPHAAYIVRLIKEYFKRCVLPDLRIKLYSITEVLLRSMGIGIAIYLAQEVVKNAFADLCPIDEENICTSSNANSSTSSETLGNHSRRKRKHGATESLEKQQIEVETSKKHSTTPISVKVAALKALKALLTEGGAFKSESWRSEVDVLLINVATSSCKGGWAKDSNYVTKSSTWADFQLIALQALLASLLSPTHVRPPHLAQGLELFRRGKQEIGTKLSEFCADALLDLEVLIHPRALPLADFSSAQGKSFDATNRGFSNSEPGASKYSIALPSGMQDIGNGPPDSDDDNLYRSWLENGDYDAPLNDQDENINIVNATETVTVDHAAQPLVVHSSGVEIPGTILGESATASVDVATKRKGDEMIVDSQQLQDYVVQSQEPTSFKGDTTTVVTGDSKAHEMGFTRTTSDNDLNYKDDEMVSTGEEASAPGNNILGKDDGSAPASEDTFTKLSAALKGIIHRSDLGSDLDNEEIPDPILTDPDSEDNLSDK
ncbi:proline-, glutamic acid- and leucine-rich protein 1 isoform X1 [Tripterygium wilfordii]|uniref:proline-, glutamic acid- and leucine-rich protein 1 isoform X1 n=1 Tax=Tripterygium wilfordii TaxID=458696 RepID=UPI0018F80BA0|nr:proline-, glutamic acid- and leucine-rich protein 1 isoform X1 [Tripterygium wilfordii]